VGSADALCELGEGTSIPTSWKRFLQEPSGVNQTEKRRKKYERAATVETLSKGAESAAQNFSGQQYWKAGTRLRVSTFHVAKEGGELENGERGARLVGKKNYLL